MIKPNILPSQNSCILKAGYGPIGQTCKDCLMLRGLFYKGIDIFVCDRNINDSIAPNQRACRFFKGKKVYYEQVN